MAKPLDPVTRYARGVTTGRIVAGDLARLACQRHLDDLRTGKQRGLAFDREAAERVLRFFPTVLRHSKGEWAGRPVELAPWQQFKLGSIFGWKRADGLRRFRTAYNAVGRKNGKSTESSGLGLYMQTADNEGGAEVFSYATKRDQARIVFDEAKNMVRKSPALSKLVAISQLNLAILKTASKFEPLSSEESSLDGLNPHCAIGDEIHAHRSRAVYDVIETAMGARRQPLHWLITTRGSNRSGICGEVDDYSIKVLKGEVQDDSWFAYIACLDEDDEWDDPDCWAKANPNLGISVKLDDLERLALKAKHAPSAQNEFRRKRCNLWTEAEERWLDYQAWKNCGGPFDAAALHGMPCYGGLDLSGSQDLTALVLIFPSPAGERILPFFWLPEDGLAERARQDQVPYDVWAEHGILRTTPGATINRRFIAAELAEIFSQYQVRALGYDRWRIEDLITGLDEIGVETIRVKSESDFDDLRMTDALPVVDWGQGFRDMSPAIDAFEGAVLAGKAAHGDHPVLTWCVSNVVVSTDPAGNRKFDKGKVTGRIDGAVAAAMAYGVMARYFSGERQFLSPSVYESRGMLAL